MKKYCNIASIENVHFYINTTECISEFTEKNESKFMCLDFL